MYRMIVASLGVSIFLAGAVSVEVAATDDARIVSVSEQDEGSVAHCSGETIVIDIDRHGETEACVQGGVRQFAQFHDGASMRLAYRPWTQEQFSLVQGACERGVRCLYSEHNDSLIQQVDHQVEVIRGVTGLLRYDQASRTYEYSGQSVRESLALDIGAIAVSSSGRWLVVEIRNKGIGLVDIETMSIRRVSAPGFRYGYGMDPRMELAVSGDGLRIMATGMNAGFTLIRVDAMCGERVTGSIGDTFPPSIVPCGAGDLGIGNAVDFRYGLSPRFIGNHQAFVRVMRHNSAYRTVKIATGDVPNQPLEYLALGDSFTSGEGESDEAQYRQFTNEVNERCRLSNRSYPFLVGIVQVWSTQSVACSGARIQDVLGTTNYRGQNDRLGESAFEKQSGAIEQFIPGRIPQAHFVDWYSPSQVTVSIGGNDSGIMGKLRACAMPGECDWVRPDRRYVSAGEIDRLDSVYRTLFRSLRQRAPHAKIYAVGYPLTITQDGSCDLLTGIMFSQQERQFMLAASRRLNHVMMLAANASNVRFIDVSDVYVGNRLCEEARSPAMNGLVWGPDIAPVGALRLIASESFHPTPFGHQLVAQRIQSAMNGAQHGCTSSCQLGDEAYWNGDGTRVRQRAVTAMLVNEPCDRSCSVDIPPATFASHGSIRATLHSTEIELGQFGAGSGDAFTKELAIPDDVADGFHTLHLYGADSSGEQLDIYQTIEVARPALSSTLSQSRSLLSVAPSTTADTVIQQATETTLHSSAQPLRMPEQVLGATVDLAPRSPGSSSYGRVLLVVVFVAIGIITTWLIFVLWLKK